MPDTDTTPSRVVDRDNYGWYRAASAGGGSHWTTGMINSYGAVFPDLGSLTAERGPVRPVLALTDDDHDDLRGLFGQAGRKTVTTLAAALDVVQYGLAVGRSAGPRDGDAWWYAKRTMMAGRAGSWEADLLVSVWMFGGGLNLPRDSSRYGSVDGARAAGPGRRVDKPARDAMAAIIRRWVTDPERYTELAETLAWVVSVYADERHGPDGWKRIADQWLQPGSLAADDFRTCYRLLYSRSEHYDPAVT